MAQVTRNIVDILRGVEPRIRSDAMSDTSAFPDGVLIAGMVVAAALAAGRGARAHRARAGVGDARRARSLTPVLLVAEIWNSPQLESVRDRGALALARRVRRRWP